MDKRICLLFFKKIEIYFLFWDIFLEQYLNADLREFLCIILFKHIVELQD